MSENWHESPPQPEKEPLPEATSQAPAFPELTKDAKTMAMLCHLLGALAGVVGSLIIWLIKKDEHPFIDDQGKEATNFGLTLLIGYLIAVVLTVVSCGFLFFMPLVPVVLQLIFGIIGATKANDGIAYRYPLNIRFIK